VLIVSRNSVDHLGECLRSIERHRPPAELVDLRVRVFDNASTDGSADLIEQSFPDAELVRSETNVGFARANNVLAAASTADYLLLLNPDTTLVSDVVTPLLEMLRTDARIAVVAPALEYPDGRRQYSSEQFPTLRFELANALSGTKLWSALRRPLRLDRVLAETRRTAVVDSAQTHDAQFVWATCWLVRRKDVRPEGLFDERYFVYDEDLDYCRRIHESGRRIVWLGSARIAHHGGSSSSTRAKERLAHASRRLYYRRHRGVAAAAAYAAVVRAVEAAKATTGFLRRRHRADPS